MAVLPLNTCLRRTTSRTGLRSLKTQQNKSSLCNNYALLNNKKQLLFAGREKWRNANELIILLIHGSGHYCVNCSVNCSVSG